MYGHTAQTPLPLKQHFGPPKGHFNTQKHVFGLIGLMKMFLILRGRFKSTGSEPPTQTKTDNVNEFEKITVILLQYHASLI